MVHEDAVALVVAFHSNGELSAAVGSLADAGVRRTLIVDNSGDVELDAASDWPPAVAEEWTCVYRPHFNLGYGGGNNVGLELVPDAYAYLIMNPDVRLNGAAFATMLETLVREPKVGVVAPRLTGPQGGTAISYYWDPSAIGVLLDGMTFGWSSRAFALASRGSRRWVSGACLLVRGEVFRRAGGFDPELFFCDDVDLCIRVHGMGYQVVELDNAVVEHGGGHSYTSGHAIYWSRASRLRLLAKHGGNCGVLVVRAWLTIECLARWMFERMMGRHERAAAFLMCLGDAILGRYKRQSYFGRQYEEWVSGQES